MCVIKVGLKKSRPPCEDIACQRLPGGLSPRATHSVTGIATDNLSRMSRAESANARPNSSVHAQLHASPYTLSLTFGAYTQKVASDLSAVLHTQRTSVLAQACKRKALLQKYPKNWLLCERCKWSVFGCGMRWEKKGTCSRLSQKG